MRWREFQVVPSRESAIECLRVYFTLGETVIRLASYIRSLGHACRVEHPIGDSDLLHIHKEWARDFEGFDTKLFPTVLMPEPPSPVAPAPAQRVHWYPRLRR